MRNLPEIWKVHALPDHEENLGNAIAHMGKDLL
jgi:hypothetical protein